MAVSATPITKFYLGSYEVNLNNYVLTADLDTKVAGLGYAKATALEDYVKTANLDTAVSDLGYAKTADVTSTYGYLTEAITSGEDGIAISAASATVDGSNVVTEATLQVLIPDAPIVDQSYSATSTNAQAGVAVAQALEPYAKSADVTTEIATALESYSTTEEMNTAITTAIGEVAHLGFESVDALPTENISTSVIYLVPNGGEGTNVKDEYIYVNGNWELIGTTELDLTPYLKTADLDTAITALDKYATTASVTTALEPYAKSADVTAEITAAVADKLEQQALTQAEWDALTEVDANTIYVVTDATA